MAVNRSDIFCINTIGVVTKRSDIYKAWLKENRSFMYWFGLKTGWWKIPFMFMSELEKQKAIFIWVAGQYRYD
jgi:hypothetical protein